MFNLPNYKLENLKAKLLEILLTYLYVAVSNTITRSNQSLIWINPNPKMSIVVSFLCVSRVVTFMVTSELPMFGLLFYILCCSLFFRLRRVFKYPSGPILTRFSRRLAMTQISMIRLLSYSNQLNDLTLEKHHSLQDISIGRRFLKIMFCTAQLCEIP